MFRIAPLLTAVLLTACSRDPYPLLGYPKLARAEFRAVVDGYVLEKDDKVSRILKLDDGGRQFSVFLAGHWHAPVREEYYDCNAANLWVPGAAGFICHQRYIPSERDSVFKGPDSSRMVLKEWGAPDTASTRYLRIASPEAYRSMLALDSLREARSDSLLRVLDTVKQLLRQKAKAAAAGPGAKGPAAPMPAMP